jgi:uncharacterized lipoprotein YddW (UPF0748 family)
MINRHRFLSAILGILLAAALSPSLSASEPKPAPGAFIQGVWMHPGLFGPDEKTAVDKMAATFDAYVRSGIDSVFILIKSTSGHVYFRCETGVADPAYRYDFFGLFLREARKRNLTVHPWFCVFTEGAMAGQVARHPEWLVRGPKGEMMAAVNPALPAARAYERGLMIELLRNYPEVDWIHLDYIRFPCEPAEPFYGYDAAARALFKAESGADPLELKAKDTGNMMWDEWLRWNATRVTLFIKELREEMKSLARPAKISAAVFPAADTAKVMIGQDWADWARTGLVDMLCPMLYTNSAAMFEKYAREAVNLGAGRCLVLPGIGIGTSHNQNTPEGMLEQIRLSRLLGSDGVVFFSSSSLNEPFLRALASAKK